jgi:hypothetical protein
MTYLAHYVYVHFRNDTNQIFYVGKGSGKRAYNSQKRNDYWKNVVKKANGYSVQIIAKNLTAEEAYNFEYRLIKELKKDSKVKLTNLVDGGKGTLNPSEETREKQRKAKLGKPMSDETKEKLRQANLKREYVKGYKHPAQANINKSIRMTGRKMPEETKQKISLVKKSKNFKHSEESKNKISTTKAVNKIMAYIESFNK